MQTTSIDLQARIEAIARYLGQMFPSEAAQRYEDHDRHVVGFHFRGGWHGDIEFTEEYLLSLPPTEAGIAHELHLRHLGAEITTSQTRERILVTAESFKHEPIGKS
jgi:hypothetical protein